jgi:hypothetical protein
MMPWLGPIAQVEGCHQDMDHYALREGAEEKLVDLLKLVGP